MADLSQLIENIHTLLCSEARPKQDALVAIAKEYAEAVEQVNARLKRCETMLHGGHRAEALRQCGLEPRLLVQASLLDFHGREQWAEYLRAYGLPTPPEILVDIAAELDDAYLQEEPLTDLMRLHRLYGLARVSLGHRISVMRRIAVLDRDPVWDTDLRSFEAVRHGQLRDELSNAVQKEDFNALSRLETELLDKNWRAKPPAEIVQKARQESARLRRGQARTEIAKVADALRAAHGDFDSESGYQLRKRWFELQQIAELDARSPLLEIVEPALMWLGAEESAQRAQEEHARNLAALEQALDNGADRPTIERLYHQAAGGGAELGEALQQRVAEQVRRIDQAADRKRKLTIAGVVAVALVLAVVTGTAIVLFQRAQDLSASVAAMRSLVDDGKLLEARKYQETLAKDAPHIIADLTMQKILSDLNAAYAKDEDRLNARRNAIEAAEKLGIAEGVWETFEGGLAEAQKAAKLSVTSSETSEVESIVRKIKEKRQKLQAEVDKKLLVELEPFATRVAKLQKNNLEEIDELAALGQKLRGREHASQNLVTRIDTLLEQLRTGRLTEITGREEARQLQQITDAVGAVDAYKSRLEAYVKRFPGTKRSDDFARTLKQDAEAWKGLAVVDDLVRRIKSRSLPSLTSMEAITLHQDLERIQAEQKGHPALPALTDILDYLDAVGQRVDSSGTRLEASLHERFNAKTVSGLLMLHADKTRYYIKEPPEITNVGYSFHYYKGFDLASTGYTSVKAAEIQNLKLGEKYDWEAPQSRFARQVFDSLDTLKPENWEDSFAVLLSNLYKDRTMEPIVKLELMKLLLQVARTGSVPLKLALAKHAEQIDNARIDPVVNWINPQDSEGRAARTKAEDVLRRMEDPAKARDMVKEYAPKIQLALPVDRYRWVAWLNLERTGKTWSCDTKSPLAASESGELHVMEPASGSKPGAMVKIGRVQAGKVVLLEPGTAFVEGRPVYLAKVK